MERLIKRDFVSRKRKTTTTTSTTIAEKKKKKKKPTPNTSDEVILLPLPYDLVLMIVARVPILYYRTLPLVSKSFRSMVASPELYKVRSILGLTETCLYVCLRFGLTSYKWHTLSLSSSSSKSSRRYVLARVAADDNDDDSPCNVGLGYSDLVAIGSDIYNIGRADKAFLRPTSGVSILDCKSHTWRKAPRMPVELDELSARVLDGKIYVQGRYHQDGSWKKSFEVFDTNTQTWDLPCCGLDWEGIACCIIDGKLHAVTRFDGVFAFDSKKCRWELVEKYPRTAGDTIFSVSYCEVDSVLYSVSGDGALRWYDSDKTRWRDLKGLVGLPKLPYPLAGRGSFVKLTGYGGGKMMVFWNRNLSSQWLKRDTIFCAEIALERGNGDCWGKLEWYDSVLSVPVVTEFVKVLAVTL
ncbi:PREDICTED: F-box/kelch-repeat protein At5g38670-like [Brassica oleracea var. oleracea]|uniref:F-box/kelch-repeat protein At5g38670-like n=1 Tax=Brassica oleracea var. oleracea TaxID=109376 RepID=UPI0006A74143|nr:PREDICTED: F-box/kelch-repeat protein At5g38670-like [Brassica oleracea var. oleracea]